MATLADFLPLIPDQSDDGFAVQLTGLAQFALNGSLASEPRPEKGEKYRHQEFASLYFLLYSLGLIVHQPGTGKSCLASAITETLKTYFLKNDDLFYTPPIKKVFVISRGLILTENWKQELVCTCTNGVYFNDDWRRLSQGQQTKKVNQALRDYYVFLTHNDLVNLVASKTDEELIDYFSNTCVIVDEAHNLIVESSDFGARIDVAETKKVYETLWNIFHKVPGMKKILMTATPMRNGPNELAQLLNLLNDEEHQITGDITDYSEEELWELMKGKISYLRKMTRKINVVEVGKPLNQILREPGLRADTIVCPCPMIDLQEEVYIETALKEKRNGVYINTRQASNMVFPDGSFGKAGFTRYVIKKKAIETKGRYNYELHDNLKDYLDRNGTDVISRLNQLKKLSSKNYELLKDAYEDPDAKGIVYSEYKQGSGAIVRMLLFEYILDYEIITNKFLSQFADDNGFCSSDAIDLSMIEKKNRIALLVPEMSKANRKALLNLYNSPQNATGELVRWCQFTPIGREGLSFNNVTKIFRDETWTDATGIQAEDRGIRSNSHFDIAKLVGGEENVTVEIYRLLPTLTSVPNRLPPNYEKENNVEIYIETTETSIKKKEEDEEKEEDNEVEIELEDDLDEEPLESRVSSNDVIYNSSAFAYYRSYLRGKSIEPMMNLARRFDATGFIHRERNLQHDALYKPYELYNPTDEEIVDMKNLDYSWYRRHPPEQLIQILIDMMTEFFRKRFSIPIQLLYNRLKNYRPELIYICLNEIIMRQVTFPNRYGYNCFLSISETTVAVVPRIESATIESEYYSTFSVRFTPQPFNAVMENYYLDHKKNELEGYLRRTVAIETILPNLPIVARNYLLERSISIILEENLKKGISIVGIKKNAPAVTTAEKVYKHYLPRIYKFGENKKEATIVTTLLSFKQTERTKHTDTSPLRNVNLIRIFDIPTKQWRNPTKLEHGFYTNAIIEQLKSKIDTLIEQSSMIYGYKIIDDPENKLRIADPVTFSDVDKRTHQTGRSFRQALNSFKAEVYWKLGIEIGMEKELDRLKLNIPAMMRELDKAQIGYNDDPDEIDYKLRWILWKQSKIVKDDTAVVENKLRELGRLIIY